MSRTELTVVTKRTKLRGAFKERRVIGAMVTSISYEKLDFFFTLYRESNPNPYNLLISRIRN